MTEAAAVGGGGGLHVGPRGDGPGPERGGCLVPPPRVVAGEEHTRALSHEASGGSEAEARGAAGDHGGLAGQRRHRTVDYQRPHRSMSWHSGSAT